MLSSVLTWMSSIGLDWLAYVWYASALSFFYKIASVALSAGTVVRSPIFSDRWKIRLLNHLLRNDRYRNVMERLLASSPSISPSPSSACLLTPPSHPSQTSHSPAIPPLALESSPTRVILAVNSLQNIDGPTSPVAEKLIGSIYRLLVFKQHVVKLASRKYDSTNPEHEKMLEELWDVLCPEIRRDARITRQWGEIGFQGSDPATDFRGMGILGLQCILHYSKTYPLNARKYLLRSKDDASYYPYCTAGIAFTAVCYEWLEKGYLDDYILDHSPSMGLFCGIFADLFETFANFWGRHRFSVMQFPLAKSMITLPLRRRFEMCVPPNIGRICSSCSRGSEIIITKK